MKGSALPVSDARRDCDFVPFSTCLLRLAWAMRFRGAPESATLLSQSSVAFPGFTSPSAIQHGSWTWTAEAGHAASRQIVCPVKSPTSRLEKLVITEWHAMQNIHAQNFKKHVISVAQFKYPWDKVCYKTLFDTIHDTALNKHGFSYM